MRTRPRRPLWVRVTLGIVVAFLVLGAFLLAAGARAKASLKAGHPPPGRLVDVGGPAGPWVLVGHSLGGPLVRLYRAAYPPEVAGIVHIQLDEPDLVVAAIRQVVASVRR